MRYAASRPDGPDTASTFTQNVLINQGGKMYDPITTCFHSSIVGQVWEPLSLTVCRLT